MSEWAPDPEPRGPISAQRNTDRGASLDPMEMGCAECGCVVDRGVIVRACKRHPDCCCRDVPASPTR